MGLLLFISGILVFSIILFGITGGILIYRNIFIRKPENKSALESGKYNVFVSHITDKKIMDPLNAAKERWSTRPLDEFTITASDRIQLHGYMWLGSESKKIAFLVHGFTDSAAGMAYLAEDYHNRNFSVFSIDCRAHGKSGGTKVGMGYRDSFDIFKWIEFLEKYCGDDCRIILHGVSMGAAAVLLYRGRYHQKSVAFIISDCSFNSYNKEAYYQLSYMIPGKLQSLVRILLLSCTSIICRVNNGFFFNKISPERAVQHNSIPILFFHGEKDLLVPSYMSENLFDATAGERRLVLIPEAPHIGCWFYDEREYFNAIIEMVAKFL